MHCEKNLCKNILRTFMGENDHARRREDMKDMGVREELWLRESANNPGQYSKPHPTYAFTPSEKQKVLDVIGSVRTPTEYAANVQTHISEGRLRFLKSHDFHVLMQQVRTSNSDFEALCRIWIIRISI
jgi:hypothetical protein